MVEHLPKKYETLSSNPSAAKKKKKVFKIPFQSIADPVVRTCHPSKEKPKIERLRSKLIWAKSETLCPK
jgi:hypothetical protein